MLTCEKCSRDFINRVGLGNHLKFCDGTTKQPRWSCPKCGYHIHSQRERHIEICDGHGPGAHKRAARKGLDRPWNKGKKSSQETKEKISRSLTGRNWKSSSQEIETERRRKISERMKKNPSAGGYRKGSGVGKGGWYDSQIAGRVYLDSTFEKRVAQCLDKHSIKWERNKEKFEYEYDGKTHYYTPDFIVEGKFVEVKGFTTDRDIAKWKHFPCNINILYEKDIIEMESGRLPKWS